MQKMERIRIARDMENLGTCKGVHSLIGGHGNDSEARRTGFILYFGTLLVGIL